MTHKLILVLVFVFLLIPFINAEADLVFKQNEIVNYHWKCFAGDGSYCSAAADCTLSLDAPNGTNLFDNSSMAFSPTYFSHNLPTHTSGKYMGIVVCSSANATSAEFVYTVTPTGRESTSFLNNPLLILLIVLAFIFIVLGIYFSISSLGFIGSILLILSGIYMMIYGFDNVTNMYTQGGAITLIGLGIIFMMLAAYEWLAWERE